MQGKQLTSGGLSPSRSTDVLKSRALAALRSGDMESAWRLYRSCLDANRNDASVWSNLGVVLRARREFDVALSCHLRALELAPGNPSLLSNLANTLKDLHRLDEAIAIHSQVATLRPDDISARLNHACVLRDGARFDEALAELDAACELAPRDARVQFERALVLLYLGQYLPGWKAYEARWRTGRLRRTSAVCPRWLGEPLQGRRLLIHAEQGFGDTILAARYLPPLVAAGALVSVQCRRPLHRLLRGIADVAVHEPGQPAGDFDYQCPMMSLMGMFATEPASIPPPPELVIPDRARRKLHWLRVADAGALKVGLVWSGSVTFGNNHNRAVALRALWRLIEIPGVRYYSLQQGPPRNELCDSGADAVIRDLAPWCDDFADTAAAVRNLDLIVMTDSAVAHLAATLGKPVVNLLEFVPYWVYATDEIARRWYPTMLPVRQAAPGCWDGVVERAGEIVRRLAAIKTSRAGRL